MNDIKFYCFDARTGVTKKWTSYSKARDFYKIKDSSNIIKSIQYDYMVYNQYLFKVHNPSKSEKMRAYKAFWDLKDIEPLEIWRGFKSCHISNMGRVKKGNDFVIPRLTNNSVVSVVIDGIKYNLARLVAELFILKRPIKSNERVFKKGSNTDLRSCMLYVDSKWHTNNAKRMNRATRKEVVLLDEENKPIKYYDSISQAAKENYLNISVLAKGLKENKNYYNMNFKYLDDLEVTE